MKKNRLLLFVLAMILAVTLIACGDEVSEQADDNSTGIEEKTEEAKQPTDEVQDMDVKVLYEKIAEGMAYEEVVEILGEEGKETASTDTGGVEGKYYEWEIDNEIIHVMFIDGKADTKAKGSLDFKASDKEITKDMYEKIKEGMIYEEVVEIAGEGEEVSKSETEGIIITMYQWINSDGSNMTIMFQNGKVDTKSQFNLK